MTWTTLLLLGAVWCVLSPVIALAACRMIVAARSHAAPRLTDGGSVGRSSELV